MDASREDDQPTTDEILLELYREVRSLRRMAGFVIVLWLAGLLFGMVSVIAASL